jgi:replicative DNA helicase
VGKWLKELGLFGQRSHQKHLPEAVFTLPNDQVALLLRHLWATDGSVTLRKPTSKGAAARVYFSTCSRALANDVAALLLRLGIIARIRTVHHATAKPVFTVDVSGAEAQLRFAKTVGGFGPREAAVAELASYAASVSANPNVDTLPVEAFAEVRATMRSRGITTRQMATMRATSYGGAAHFRFSPSRRTLSDYAGLLDAPELSRWSESDVFWDRVVSVVPDGERDVFDLTVPGPACWLADSVVTHNSGAIEQDADMILLIYREEVYDKNTTKKGIAEIELVKHRNGEIGGFVLTFQGQFTRFANYAPDSYADGVLR